MATAPGGSLALVVVDSTESNADAAGVEATAAAQAFSTAYPFQYLLDERSTCGAALAKKFTHLHDDDALGRGQCTAPSLENAVTPSAESPLTSVTQQLTKLYCPGTRERALLAASAKEKKGQVSDNVSYWSQLRSRLPIAVFVYPFQGGPRTLPWPENKSSADIFTTSAPATVDGLTLPVPTLTRGWKDILSRLLAGADQQTAGGMFGVASADGEDHVPSIEPAAYKRLPWCTFGTVSNPAAIEIRSYFSPGVSRPPKFTTSADGKVSMECKFVCKAPGCRFTNWNAPSVSGGICGASVKLIVIAGEAGFSVNMEEPCVHRASAMYPEHAKRGSTPIPEVFGSKVSSMGSVQDASLQW